MNYIGKKYLSYLLEPNISQEFKKKNLNCVGADYLERHSKGNCFKEDLEE